MNITKWLRIIATPLTIFGSLIVLISGLVMYFIFKNKMLEELHAQIGVLFTIGVILHVFINWRTFTNYFKKAQSYLVIIPIIVIALNLVFFSESKSGLSPGLVFGKLENSSLATVSLVFKVDPDLISDKLKSSGLSVGNNEQSIKEIAEINQKNPKEILAVFTTLNEGPKK